jgi:hypothetical protein
MRNVSKAVAGVAFVAGLDCVASTKLGLKVSPRAERRPLRHRRATYSGAADLSAANTRSTADLPSTVTPPRRTRLHPTLCA